MQVRQLYSLNLDTSHCSWCEGNLVFSLTIPLESNPLHITKQFEFPILLTKKKILRGSILPRLGTDVAYCQHVNSNSTSLSEVNSDRIIVHCPLWTQIFFFMHKCFYFYRPKSLRRVCFHRCLSVHREGNTWAGTPPGQVHPPGRHNPSPSLGRYPQAGTPPGQVHPLGRYTPQAGTPPGKYTPLPSLGRHPFWADTSTWAGTPQAGTPPTPPWVGRPPRQVPPRQVHHPWPQCMLGYGQLAGGTHPTGMHSC